SEDQTACGHSRRPEPAYKPLTRLLAVCSAEPDDPAVAPEHGACLRSGTLCCCSRRGVLDPHRSCACRNTASHCHALVQPASDPEELRRTRPWHHLASCRSSCDRQTWHR